MADLTMLYKLLVLYMLNRADLPLANMQISDFMLGKEYTNYFTLQQVLAEMADGDLIRKESTHNRSIYHLTEAGKKTLDLFRDRLSPEIRADVDEYLAKKHCDIKDDTSAVSDYYREKDGSYIVRCRILGTKDALVDLTLKIASEKEAETIVTNWYSKSQEIYASILGALL